jgi:hypothetical protein
MYGLRSSFSVLGKLRRFNLQPTERGFIMRRFGSFVLGIMLIGMLGCATAKSGGVANVGQGCIDAPLDGPDWTPVGGKFTPEDKDKCNRTVSGTFWMGGVGASFEKEVRGMQAGTTWYTEATVVSSCAEINVVTGSPGGGMMPGRSMGGNRYAAAGYVQSSSLAVAVLMKNGKSGCDVKISGIHITQTPPAGMDALPPAPGAPGPVMPR